MSDIRNVHLYRPVIVQRQSFAGVKRQTVPNQSLSLREIIKRYVRREPLPGTVDGVYEDRYGDLEKLSRADITVQMEKAEELRAKIKEVRDKEIKRVNDERERLKKELENRDKEPKAEGEPPVKSPPPKGA